MAIFLRQSHNVKPSRWGSFADVQYAIRVNSEKIYDCDPDDDVLVMPLFWGLPCLDYSMYNNHGTNHGATYKDGSLDFDGVDDYIEVANSESLDITTNEIFIRARIKFTTTYDSGSAEEATLIETVNKAAIRWEETDGKLWFGLKTGVWSAIQSVQSSWTGKIWYDIDLSYDGVNKYLYVDGDLDNSGADTGDINTTNYPLRFSYPFDGVGKGPFPGSMDDLRIAKTTRTADQIALFNDNKYGLYQPVSRPIWSIPAAGVTIPIFMQNMRGSFNSPGTRGGFIN